MKDYGKKYQKCSSPWYHESTTIRIVNQQEIVNYFIDNPGRTETQMQRELYDYDRSTSWCSNKKYASCLRRALQSNKIQRAKAKTTAGTRYVYFATVK